MARFDFIQKNLIKVWETSEVSVEADSLEDAKELIKSYGKDAYCLEDGDIDYGNSEIEYNTLTLEQPENNGGIATNEWYVDGEREPFFTNKPE